MTDINKLNLLINAEIIENRSNYALFNEGMKKGAEIAQSIILHQNRWRKVEEELPEVQEKQYQIAIRAIGSPSSASIWNIRDNFDLRIFDNLKGCEWKPIT